MKTPWDIPLNSRTVLTGIAAIVLGVAKLVMPELKIEAAPEQLILFGAGLVYLRGAKE